MISPWLVYLCYTTPASSSLESSLASAGPAHQAMSSGDPADYRDHRGNAIASKFKNVKCGEHRWESSGGILRIALNQLRTELLEKL